MTEFAIAGARIFDGTRMLDGHAVVVAGARIERVVPAGDLPGGIEVRKAAGLLAPGFIDVQVNGGGGVLFNESPTVDGIRAIGAAHRRFGTTGFLPTLITDTRDAMVKAIDAVRAALAANVPGLLGIHLEGPFLNPLRKGAHDAGRMRAIEDEDIRIITSLGTGRTLVTLAPEPGIVPPEAIERLTRAGVVVSAGHTMASAEMLAEARRRGLSAYTHLFNAMPPMSGREPGPVGAALIDPKAWCSLIVDLQHVSKTSLRAAIAARGPSRMLLITDAMSVTGTGLASFELQGRTIFRRDGRLALADGTLAGSDLDMATAVRNCVAGLSLDLATALAMASLNPAAFLGLGEELGRIAPGYRASMVLLDDGLNVRATWIDGGEEAAGG